MNQIYFSSCGRQSAVCQEALQRPKRLLHPAGLREGQKQMKKQFTGWKTWFSFPSLSSCLVQLQLAQKIQRTTWEQRQRTTRSTPAPCRWTSAPCSCALSCLAMTSNCTVPRPEALWDRPAWAEAHQMCVHPLLLMQRGLRNPSP